MAASELPVLKLGDRNSHIAIVQGMFTAWGFFFPLEDLIGVFDPFFELAVKRFQAVNKIEQTGILDEPTWNKIIHKLREVDEQ